MGLDFITDFCVYCMLLYKVMNDEDKQIIEGEEVIDTKEITVENIDGEGNNDQVMGLLSLEELIKGHIESIEKLKGQIRESREMFEDSFVNNPTYKEASDKLKDVSKSRNSVRQQIAKQPSVSQLAQKVKDLRFDLNEQQKTLSDLLQDYHEQTGLNQIETRDGQTMEIVSTSRLVRKSSKYNP